MKILFSIIFAFASFVLYAQDLGFDSINNRTGLPHGWKSATFDDRSVVRVDTAVGHNGSGSLNLSGLNAFAWRNFKLEYEASEMLVSGYLLTTELDGHIELSVQTLSGESIYNQQNHIGEYKYTVNRSNSDWERFEIELPLCKEVTHFRVSIGIKGKGSLWVGDLNIDYDGRPYTEAPPKKSKKIKYAAAKDKRYHDGSNFSLNGQITDTQIDNLMLLCRVWGFLKYYHPAVRGGMYNWDNELFAILPQVYNLGTTECNQRLYEWVAGLSDFPYNNGVCQSECYIPETLTWIYDREALGGDLSSALVATACSERGAFCYYASPMIGIGYINSKNEKNYKNISFADDGMKLLSIYRLWNFVELFYPYKQLTDNWNDVLRISIIDVVKTADEDGYNSALKNMTQAMRDSHCAVMPKTTIWKLLKMRNYYKYGASFLSEQYHDGGFWVTYSFGTDDNDLKKGDIIYAIDDHGTDDYIKAFAPKSSYANFNTFANEAAYVAGFTTGAKQRKYSIDRNGEIMDVTIDLLPRGKVMRKGRAAGIRDRSHAWLNGVKLGNYEIISDSILYINAEKVTDGELKNLFGNSLSYKNYIIDLRGYPKSYMFRFYLDRLMPGVHLISSTIIPSLQFPGHFDIAPGDYTGTGEDMTPHSIIVLVDEKTQSHAEYCAMLLQTAPNTWTIGTPSAGADGNVIFLDLPGNYRAMFGGIGVAYPDMRQTEQTWVHIDETVEKTVESFRRNSDAVIERAVEMLR